MLQQSGKFLTANDVARVLTLERRNASRTLMRWQKQGLVKRIKRGLYTPIPLDTPINEQVFEDPWVMVPRLFGAAYIAGWSAAEHWGLTEQVFRSIYVFTTQPVKRKLVTFQGIDFVLKHIPVKALFGTTTEWRDSTKISVSSAARTLIDMLDDPSVGGGIRHVSECLATFLKDNSAAELIELGDRIGRGAIFKRLGFLLERLQAPDAIVQSCRTRLTPGLAKLDPALLSPHVVKRWQLRIPASWKLGEKA